MNTISIDKKYTTRSGLPVRILCVDAKDSQPIVGLITCSSGKEIAASFGEDGRYWPTKKEEDEMDLVEVKEKKKAYWIVGVSPTKTLERYGIAYSQKESETLRLLARKESSYIDWYIHEIEYEV